MTNEISFIKEIEKRECLYNSSLPEYNRRDAYERAWSEVARSRHLTVNECKEKWRNIRNSFLRSMKKTDKVKKPYSLALLLSLGPYLQFVVPFTKLGQMEFAEELQRDESQTSLVNEMEIQINSVKFELDEEHNPFEGVFETGMSNENDSARFIESTVRDMPIYRRRKRPIVSRKREETRPTFKRKSAVRLNDSAIQNNSVRLSNSTMRYFLLSLLPDFDTMTEDQIRTFKIKVMMLIDGIKTNFAEVRKALTPPIETHRLQTRLINLLLKNLQKNS